MLILLLGLWGGLIPFVGPYFNYAMHANHTWQWFGDRFWLEVLPAICAVVGGLILMGGMTRISTSFGAMVALAGGLWFIIGPSVSMLWNHGVIAAGPAIGAHNITRTLEWIGFFYGTGALITLFSAYALGFMAALPIVDERVVGRTTAAGAGTGAGYAAGRAATPRREAEPAAPAAETERTAPAPVGTATAPAAADRTARAPAAAGDGATTTSTAPAPAPQRRRGGLFRRRRRATTRT